MPFFPQGGKKAENVPYGMQHRYNQVVFECEVTSDIDYTNSHDSISGKTGESVVVFEDMQEMPSNGLSKFATNPITKANIGLGEWVISGSLKSNRALTQEECDEILQKNGLEPQQWEQ